MRHDATINFHELRTAYTKDTVIFREDDARDKAYIIERGEVEISTLRNGSRVPLVRLGPGEIFGETALLGTGKRSATAVAVQDTEVFAISPAVLHARIMHLDPLAGLLMSLLVNRYRRWRYVAPEDAGKAAAPAQEEESLPLSGYAEGFIEELNRQRETALHELRLGQEITRALEQDQFVPYLQPIVTLPEKKLCGFEALIRWRHPEKGVIPPLAFLPIAERAQMALELDMLMLRRACEIAPELQKAAGDIGRRLYVSVNLSGVHFDSGDFADRIADIVTASGADPRHIVLEITESALMGAPATAEKVLKAVRALGLRVALDDFGTGYSSLGYLHRFSIDILKIDRAFVQDIHSARKSTDIVRAIVSLAKTFHLDVVAEGIESENEISTLTGLGCDYGQGYVFSKPLPAEEALAFVKDSVGKNG